MNFKNTKIIKNLIKIQSTWQNFINLINESILNKKDFEEVENKNYSRTGLVRFYDKLTMVIDDVEQSKCLLLDSNKIKNYLIENEMKPDYEIAIVSFTNSEKTTGRHFDNYDVFYVQFIGSVIWKIWEEKENIYILHPGDCIFVPKKTYHEIKSLTPRASVSFILNMEN